MPRFSDLLSCAALLAATASVAQAATTLPFPAGWYVEAGETCAEGNDATLLHLHEAGFTNRYGMCQLDAVGPGEDGGLNFAATCTDPEQGVEFLNEGTVQPISASAFQIRDGVMDLTYELCPASSLPAPYGD